MPQCMFENCLALASKECMIDTTERDLVWTLACDDCAVNAVKSLPLTADGKYKLHADKCRSCGLYDGAHEVDCLAVQHAAREKLQAECDHQSGTVTRTTGDPPGAPCCRRCGLELLELLRPPAREPSESWAAFLPTVHVGGALPVTFRADGDYVVVEVIVSFVPPPPQAPSDLTKIPIAIAEGFPVPVSARYRLPPFSPVNAADFLRDIVRQIYHHEIDEQLHVNGQRPFAPEH